MCHSVCLLYLVPSYCLGILESRIADLRLKNCHFIIREKKSVNFLNRTSQVLFSSQQQKTKNISFGIHFCFTVGNSVISISLSSKNSNEKKKPTQCRNIMAVRFYRHKMQAKIVPRPDCRYNSLFIILSSYLMLQSSCFQFIPFGIFLLLTKLFLFSSFNCF